jgi:hypothetical protein
LTTMMMVLGEEAAIGLLHHQQFPPFWLTNRPSWQRGRRGDGQQLDATGHHHQIEEEEWGEGKMIKWLADHPKHISKYSHRCWSSEDEEEEEWMEEVEEEGTKWLAKMKLSKKSCQQVKERILILLGGLDRKAN